MFLKLFIPTWKFFDQLGTVSKLYYRTLNQSGCTEWMPVIEKPDRRLLNLFYNPKGNLYLACVALVDRLVFEMGAKSSLSADQIEQLESYLFVQNMVHVLLRSKNVQPKIRFQFKIEVQSEQTLSADFLISKELVL